jgi:2-methylisocitrate lyase-like PEP mutase family enzyme
VAEHVRLIDGTTRLPVSVDLEDGYGRDPGSAAAAIERVAGAGAVGGSIEDCGPDKHIYSMDHAVEMVAAAVEAARALSFAFMVTARADNFIRGNPDLDDTIARLQAYERAGADVLYAPGLATRDAIAAVCEAVSKPVNVLARPGMSVAEIAAAGARRISMGGALTWVAADALVRAAEAIRDRGDFGALEVPVKFKEWLET